MKIVQGFDGAFNHAMLYEVGPWFDPTDEETIKGLCSTPAQKRKVGYCNVPGDRGGVTKFGVAQNFNKNVDVEKLTLQGAITVYWDAYWTPSKCNQITSPIHLYYFDMVINNGLSRGAKILQQSVGVQVDGQIGSITLKAVNSLDPKKLIEDMHSRRVAWYHAIVNKDPVQQKFLNGWLRRDTEVRQAALSIFDNL